MRDRALIGERFDAVLAAARCGEEWAFEVLYAGLQPALLGYLRSRAGQDAGDVASATWLDAARGLRGFTGDEGQFRSWLFTIARRRLTDLRRAEWRRPSRATDAIELVGAPPARSAEDAAFDDGDLGEESVRRIVACLPDDQAEIVLLRVVGGLSVDEVASIVGRKAGTVRVMQHRALRRLAAAFEEGV